VILLAAEEGMESTLAGWASALFSETSAAWRYWTIMSPDSSPGFTARNGGRPLFPASRRR